jgi:hypothetical protein
MNLAGVFSRVKAAAIGLGTKLGPRPPAMLGTPPSARQIPAHPQLHARDFAERYAEPLNYHVENRMMELGIDPAKIGASDADHGIRHAAFMPHEVDGGGNAPDGRLNLDG